MHTNVQIIMWTAYYSQVLRLCELATVRCHNRHCFLQTLLATHVQLHLLYRDLYATLPELSQPDLISSMYGANFCATC